MMQQPPSSAWKTRWQTLLFFLLALVTIAVGAALGSKILTPLALFNTLLHPDGHIDTLLVWQIRLPRSLLAFVAGSGLALSGYVMQALTRNPLATPELTGVTAGSVLPIVFCFVYLPWFSSVWYPFIGLFGGLVAALMVFILTGRNHKQPLILALNGVSVSIFLGAITTWVILSRGAQIPSLLFWISGGLQGRSWSQLLFMLPWVVVAAVVIFVSRRVLELLSIGDQTAAGMGINLHFWQPFLLLLAVLPVAGITPVCGPLSFVGLAAPHIARLLRPEGVGNELLLTATLGALIVTLADVLARTLALPQELPVGILTVLLGGPVFIWLVQQRHFNVRGSS